MNRSYPRCALYVALLACAVLARPVAGQTIAAVRGTVTNETGRPIEYAQVTLDPQGATKQVRTDRDARFNRRGISASRYRLTVAASWMW